MYLVDLATGKRYSYYKKWELFADMVSAFGECNLLREYPQVIGQMTINDDCGQVITTLAVTAQFDVQAWGGIRYHTTSK